MTFLMVALRALIVTVSGNIRPPVLNLKIENSRVGSELGAGGSDALIFRES